MHNYSQTMTLPWCMGYWIYHDTSDKSKAREKFGSFCGFPINYKSFPTDAKFSIGFL